MAKPIPLLGAIAAVVILTAATTAPARTAQPEKYLRAVPAGPSPIRCRRVCVKTRRPGPAAAPVCVQWREVC